MNPRTALPNHPSAVARQRGAATLVMVLGLFMMMALAAAYTSRGLMFEQRISSNNLRATQAFEAAEAGLEWAIGMLGQGRVDANCLPTVDAGASTFRDRYLVQDANGLFSASAGQAALRPACVLSGGNFTCSCPAEGGAVVLPAVAGLAPAFQVRFVVDPALARPGMLRVESRGCNSIGTQCDPGQPVAADAEATVSTLVALSPALASPPLAAMTVRANLNLGGGAARVASGDGTGMALAVGGSVSNDSSALISGAPGSPTEAAQVSGDGALGALSAQRLFVSVFGVDAATYKHQPAVLHVNCSSGCTETLAQAAGSNPGRPIWIDGDLVLTGDVSLGSDSHPQVLVVKGDIRNAGDFRLKGLLYLAGTQWDVTSGSAQVQGAVVAENDLTVSGAPVVSRDDALLERLRLRLGSLVRVPGGWRDFVAR
jgi:PilX N-terminal